MAHLSISAFAADPAHTARDIRRAQESGADRLHIDVMDGHFVTLMGLTTSWLGAMRPRIRIPIDVHFMTLSPERFIPQFARFGVDSMVFHVEGCEPGETVRALDLIKGLGLRRGLAISPGTPLAALDPFLDVIDNVLILSSQPGQPGSKFEPGALERVRALGETLSNRGSTVGLSVDGGLNRDTALACIANGADTVILGRAFFKNGWSDDITAAIHGGG